MTILYINKEHCKDFAQLKNYFKSHLTNSNIYAELLEDGRDGVMAKFLQELGEQQLANMIEKIDQNLCDHDYMNHLTAIITGNKQSIKKPHYSKFFVIEKALYKRNNKEVTVSLQIKILEHVNEDYIIHIVSSFGFDAIKINTSKIDYDSITKHISFPNDKKKFSGNIKIDDEKVISDIPNINREDANENNQSINPNTVSDKTLPLVKSTHNTLYYTDNKLELGNEFVDLGLSVLWANCNLGAISPEMVGNYYTSIEAASMRPSIMSHLPTEANFNELKSLCRFEIGYFNNVKVCEVTGPNRNKIYFPLGGYKDHTNSFNIQYAQKGYYWSRTAGSYYGNLKCWITDNNMVEFKNYLTLVRMVRAKNFDFLKVYLLISAVNGSIAMVNQTIVEYYNGSIDRLQGVKLPYVIKKAIPMKDALLLKSKLEGLGAVVDIEMADV